MRRRRCMFVGTIFFIHSNLHIGILFGMINRKFHFKKNLSKQLFRLSILPFLLFAAINLKHLFLFNFQNRIKNKKKNFSCPCVQYCVVSRKCLSHSNYITYIILSRYILGLRIVCKLSYCDLKIVMKG